MPRCSFSCAGKLRLDEFGVKFSRQSFQPCSTSAPASQPSRESTSSPAVLSLSRVTCREPADGRHAHAATTFRVQKLCLWAEKIYRLWADIHIASPGMLYLPGISSVRNVGEGNSSCVSSRPDHSSERNKRRREA